MLSFTFQLKMDSHKRLLLSHDQASKALDSVYLDLFPGHLSYIGHYVKSKI